jgi:hypothetical protein
MKYRRAIHDIEDEEPSRVHMSAGSSKGGERISILQMIAQHTEHHQGGIDMSSEINRANFSLVKDYLAIRWQGRCFSPRMGEHGFGAIYPDYLIIAPLSQGKRMVTRPTP